MRGAFVRMFEVFIVAKWLLVFAALAVIGAPLAAVVFRQFPRRGAAFAIPAALLPTVLLVSPSSAASIRTGASSPAATSSSRSGSCS